MFRGKIIDNIGEDVWNTLDDMEKKILMYMGSHKLVTTTDLAAHVERTSKTVSGRLNHLIELNIIKRNGTRTEPKQT